MTATTITRPNAPTKPPREDAGPPPLIAVENVSKLIGDHAVLNEVTFDVPQRQIFGVIGPSGSGKSVLLRMLVGQMVPTSGTVRVLGVEPRDFGTAQREEIGYVAQGFLLYPTLTVEQNARFAAGLYGLGWRHRRRRIRESLELLGLWDARNRLASNISGGMKRRLSFACALLHSPRILFVDEPTAGLDPILRSTIWDHLRYLADHGTTVFVTTQYLDEAVLCDRVALVHSGELAALGTPAELRRQALGGDAIEVEAPLFDAGHVAALRALPCVHGVTSNRIGTLRIVVDDVRSATPLITAALTERGGEVTSIETREPTFDEVFVALVEQAERNTK